MTARRKEIDMADPARSRQERSGPRPAPPIPRWVKAFGAAVIALLLLFIILHLTGNGMAGHG